jgi:uncharacterized membrane protein
MKRTLRRLLRHLVMDRGDLHRMLPPAALARIEKVIGEGEARHAGQVCFAVEAALPVSRVWQGTTPRQRALEAFSLLRVWDTEHNDGVLIYVLLADRDVEIVADRGIHAKVGDAAWTGICQAMEKSFRAGRYGEAVEEGVHAVSDLLARHSPRTSGDRNEIPDRPVVL